jgi:ATP-binding cassette, subfamily C, bacterial CydC
MKAFITILGIVRGQWRWLGAGIVLGLLVIAANVFLMALSGWFIASMAVAGASGAAFNYQLPAVAIRALAIVRTLSRYGERLVTHEAALRMMADLRVWFFQRLEPLSPAVLERYGAGDLAGRLRADVDALENLYLRVIAPLIVGVLTIILGVALAARWSGPGAAALLTALTTAGIALPLLVQRLAREPGRSAATLAGELRVAVTEGIDGAEELLLLGAAERQAEQVELLSSRLVAEQQRLARIGALAQAGTIFCAGSGLAAVLALAGGEVTDGTLSGPSLVLLLLFTGALFEAAALLPVALQAAPATLESLRRILTVAHTPPPVPAPSHPVHCPTEPVAISFRMASCSYTPGRDALQRFSLYIAAGERVALVGPSGSGKSTVLEVLLRFRPYEGDIFLGGVELRSITDDDLHRLVTAVPQRPHLFNTTIRDNILLARPEASGEELSRAVADAGLAAWIEGLPHGFDTLVGEQGGLVSGGEARRIALARALLRDAPIMLLDEPTEGLDGEMERLVVDRLAVRITGKTVLLITHRRACLRLVDRVVTLEECSSEPDSIPPRPPTPHRHS